MGATRGVEVASGRGGSKETPIRASNNSKIVMDEHHCPNGIPVTCFTLQSMYAQSDEENLEFEYDSVSTNILANDYTSQTDISSGNTVVPILQLDVKVQAKAMQEMATATGEMTVEM